MLSSGKARVTHTTTPLAWHGKRRVYDLCPAVADKPEKNVRAARKALHNFLRLVDQAEKRGLTLHKERAKLSPKGVARLRRNVKISFTNWAQT